jgi:hypothetical protein
MAVSGQVVTVYMIIIKIIILSKRFSWYQNTKRQEAGGGKPGSPGLGEPQGSGEYS